MGDSFADLRKASREPGGAQALIERKRGGNIPPDRTFATGQAAVSNARQLAAKGDIRAFPGKIESGVFLGMHEYDSRFLLGGGRHEWRSLIRKICAPVW